MARVYTLTARVSSGEVRHERFDTLGEALDGLERSGHSLQGQADADVVGGNLVRRFQPEQQVTARLEVSGRGVRAGVDIRGDGSAVPFTGRVRRKEVRRERDESAYNALRRAVSG
jgi:hypothetical protein